MQQQIEKKVQDFIDRQALLPKRGPIIVGLSGGPDSTALLLLLQRYWKRIKAIHINHCLRGESADRDEQWCASFCNEHGIEFVSEKMDVNQLRKPGESIEMGGRRLRLDYWQKYDVVALGHHRDDVVETAMMRLCRGANSSGLTSLRPKTLFEGVEIVRPLLCLTRTEIERYLRHRGVQDFCEDESNNDTRFLRNKVRHELIPILREVAGGPRSLYKTLDFLTEDAQYLEEVADKVDVANLHTETLRKAHDAIFARIIRNWMLHQTETETVVGEQAILRLREAVAHGPKRKTTLVDLNGDYFIKVTPSHLFLEPKTGPELKKTMYWKWHERPRLRIPDLDLLLVSETATEFAAGSDAEVFEVSSLSDTLTIRPWKAGDRMIPFGSDHPKKLKKLISDRRLTAAQKRALFVIANSDGTIIWVPGVRRAEIGRAGDSNRKLIRMKVVKAE